MSMEGVRVEKMFSEFLRFFYALFANVHLGLKIGLEFSRNLFNEISAKYCTFATILAIYPINIGVEFELSSLKVSYPTPAGQGVKKLEIV